MNNEEIYKIFVDILKTLEQISRTNSEILARETHIIIILTFADVVLMLWLLINSIFFN